MDRWKAEMERVREKRRVEERRSEKRKSQKKEDAGARKDRNVLAKAAGAELWPDERWKIAQRCGTKPISKSKCTKHTISWTTFGSWDVEKVHAVVAQSTFASEKAKNTSRPDHFWKLRCWKRHAVVARSSFRSQNAQNTPGADHFWKLRCWKRHAVVARSSFRSQNAQNTPGADHFWKLRCRKSARRCGAKHICKWKREKHRTFGPLLGVEMSKKCSPLWREAHFEVKMYKTYHFSDHFWKLRCRKSARRCGAKHISKSKCETHHMFAPLLDVEMSFRVAGARDCAPCQKWAKREGSVAFSTTTTTTPHYTPIHYTTTTTTPSLHSTTLRYTTLHSTTLHCTQVHSITLNHATLRYTTLHSTTLH